MILQSTFLSGRIRTIESKARLPLVLFVVLWTFGIHYPRAISRAQEAASDEIAIQAAGDEAAFAPVNPQVDENENPINAVVPKIGSIERTVILEVAFVKQVVKLSEVQKARLNEITEAKLTEGVPKLQRNALNQLFQNRAVRVQPDDALSHRKTTRALEKTIEEILDKEQYETYKREQKLRNDFRMDASSDRLVELLDTKLSLNSEQKIELKKRFLGWNKLLDIPFNAYESNDHLFPVLPPNLIGTLLNTKQQEILSSIQQVEIGGDGHVDWILGNVLIGR